LIGWPLSKYRVATWFHHGHESTDLAGAGAGGSGYDVSAAGQRFLTVAPVEGANSAPPKIRIVQNWHEEFRDRE
jgi:hypothetical protein